MADTAAAGAAPAGMVESSVAPNETIYLSNLNEKVKKAALKKSLYTVFSQFGPVLDVVATKTKSLRGQAWVVFDDVETATAALRNLQGFPFFDKPLHIQFSKTKSDAVLKRDGKFVPRNKRKADGGQPPAKKVATGSSGAAPVLIPAPPPKVSNAPPNRILFAEGLPPSVTAEKLTELASPFGGFKEVRLVAGKGVAFIEFDHEAQSTIAMQALQNYRLEDSGDGFLRLSYAKK